MWNMQPSNLYYVKYNPNENVIEQLKYYKHHYNENVNIVITHKPLFCNGKLLKVYSQTTTVAIRLSTSESLLESTKSILTDLVVYRIVDANTEHDYGEVKKNNINTVVKNIFGIKDSKDATKKT